MPSFHANTPDPAADKPHVVFVVYPGIVMLDLVGPLHVFSRARETDTGDLAYQTHVASVAGGPVPTNTIVEIDSLSISDLSEAMKDDHIDTLVVVGGDGAIASATDSELVDWVRRLAERSRRTCSVCCGAFVLAAAGLLDGRRAVTHWEDCDLLADRFPNVRVEVDPIFVKDGPIWTSAGITAGIDLALAMVREDLGKGPVLQLAKSLVTPMIRTSGQSQYSADLARQTKDAKGEFAALHHWLHNNLERPIDVNDMAEHCAMSARSFSRWYKAAVGISPAKSLEHMRVDAARKLLEDTDRSTKVIAKRCGFGDQEKMRRAFHRHLQTSPSQYRSVFSED